MLKIKSKFDSEFRRWSINRTKITKFEDFQRLTGFLHKLSTNEFSISYVDPSDNYLLPINNDDNYSRAINKSKSLLNLIIHRKDEFPGYNTVKSKNSISSFLGHTPRILAISNPRNFRQVSQIIDVDIVPETCRRVRLLKHGSDKPLGFYIRDGKSLKITPNGIDKQPGIFISRLVSGGLAESTGLLAVNDEILEVNGIEVIGKSLDQVTDMMIANSSNLIITVRPANQETFALPRRGSFSRNSKLSTGSKESKSTNSSDELDQDEVTDLTSDVTGITFLDESSFMNLKDVDGVLHF